MDHLPQPQELIHPVPEFRLLEASEYDGLDLITYPDRQNWGERRREDWIALFRYPPRSFVAFLERWLLIGPISVVSTFFGTVNEFVKFEGHPQYPVFTTRNLPALVQYLSEAFNLSDRLPGMIDIVMSFISISQTHVLLSDAEYGGDSNNNPQKTESLLNFLQANGKNYRDPRNPEIVMATTMMIEMIYGIFHMDFKSLSGLCMTSKASSLNDGNGLVRYQMRRSGWCPSELSRFFTQFNTSCLYFIQNLQRPKPFESHDSIRIRSKQDIIKPPISTPLCTPFTCAYRQLREDRYETQHIIGCDGCDDIVADPSELGRILSQGKIPLILSIDDTNYNKDIQFVEYEPESGLAYIAISHVWSDGLGNVERNALPRCQLLRLSRMIQNLRGNDSDIVLFWCDTICVPPDAADMSEAQALAMGQMRNVYAEANAVLVLDSWLYSSTSEDRTDIEVLLKIFCSTWNTRLWTFQEGALAKRLHFQFEDGPCDLDARVESLENCANPIERLTVVHQLLVRHHILRGFKHQQTKLSRMSAIAPALSTRTTSVRTDEALCLAVLLGLDAAEIARTEPDMRMAAMWRMLPTVAQSLAFTDRPTFDIPGLRWAPITFLKSPGSVSLTGKPVGESTITQGDFVEARRDESGLYIGSRGLIFRSEGRPFGAFYVQDQGEYWWHVLSDTVSGVTACRPGELAVILNDNAAAKAEGYTRAEWEKPIMRKATVVQVVRKTSGTIYCQPLRKCLVSGSFHDSPLSYIPFMPLKLNSEVDYYDRSDGTLTAVRGTCTAGDQTWCIG